MKKLTTFAMAAVLSLSAACDDGGITQATGDTLTTAEFASMSDAYTELNGIAFDMIGSFGAGAPGLAAQANGSISFSVSADCPASGSASVSGTGSGNETSATVTITQTMTNCGVYSQEEVLWTFNSDPNVKWTMNFTQNPETGDITYTATQTGGFTWVSGEREGGCRVNLSINITGNIESSTINVSIEGTVCGVTVDEQFSSGPA
jgi:hypothetical protein